MVIQKKIKVKDYKRGWKIYLNQTWWTVFAFQILENKIRFSIQAQFVGRTDINLNFEQEIWVKKV